MKLLKKAKEKGYFIRCIYVLTSNYKINIIRVNARKLMGGHSVPEDKIKSRYNKALNLFSDLIEICDIVHIYDNTDTPFRIFKKRKDKYYYWENKFWNCQSIKEITGINDFIN